ncbi:uncharacterized protein LOC131928244 [Physella acuta]|uniref:uncharacterized protein LOC131928244 n=1 Tax=Physella acuta TaxID=109671 RepID=UPI0027DE3BD5|nr:uncharacterized protein LOC131928244 [Physella acuta]
MAKNHFNVVDIAIVFVSLITFVLDVSTDVLVCVQFLLEDQTICGWLMVLFIVAPSIIMSGFSLAWHINDKTLTPFGFISHLLLLSPVHRYLSVIYYGINSFRTNKASCTQNALKAQSDAAILRLFATFLESAPQLILQIYVIMDGKGVGWFTGISIACSLLSLSWSVTAYSDCQRRAHSSLYRRRLIRLILYWGWQLFMIGARISAFVFFARTYNSWILAVMGVHWLVAFICISVRGTDFGTGCCETWLLRLACAFIYIFVFLNLNDGPSRWRIVAYYLLVLLENIGMVTIFLVLGNGADLILVACLVVFAGFFLGILCMILYYVFLHPGSRSRLKRILKHPSGALETSRSIGSSGPHIFSIESPRPVGVMKETSINVSQSSLHSKSSCNQKTWAVDQSILSSNKTSTGPNVSQLNLQRAWQSGMVCSSGSSSVSSLASTEELSAPKKYTPSIKSDNSHDSTSSENHLLSPGLNKNDLNMSSQEASRFDVVDLNYFKTSGGDVSASDNNVHSPVSNSPALSRSSWARSSDYNRQSTIVENFTVLGFDDSSSTEKKNSDSSSFSSHLKSLSPLNVANLLKDVNGRLRATIAATIAAATGNPSSNEGTPNRSQSISSCNSVHSTVDESFNSYHNTSSHNHNTAFVDSSSSIKDKESLKHNIIMNFSRREALSSLPNIVEALDPTPDSSFDKTTAVSLGTQRFVGTKDKTVVCESYKSPGDFSKASNFSFPQDSTLTASKLNTSGTSYLSSQRDYFQSQHKSKTDLSSMSSHGQVSCQDKWNTKDDDRSSSPFTDLELVAVMANSLQSYVGGSSSDSHIPEREGLALTLDDLRISREGSPVQNLATSGRSRSASSLFHDSTESSPASSASKMNQLESLRQADAKLSPNAFKLLEIPTELLGSLNSDSKKLHEIESLTAVVIPQSLALKYIMESYGSGTPVSHKSLKLSHPSNSWSDLPIKKHFGSDLPTKKGFLTTSEELTSPDLNQHRIRKHNQGTENHIRHTTNEKESIARSMKKTPSVKSPQCFEVCQTLDQNSKCGVSSTKKLNVHFSKLPLEQRKTDKKPEQDTENGYVAGQYHPPLYSCDEASSLEMIAPRKQHCAKRNSFDLNSESWNDFHLHADGKKKTKTTKEMKQYDLKHPTKHSLEKHNSDILSLKQQMPDKRKFLSHSNLQSHAFPNYVNKKETNVKQGKRQTVSFNQFHSIEKLTDNELQLSAQHIADYYKEVLEDPPLVSSHVQRSKRFSAPQVQSPRQPLQSLDNSQHAPRVSFRSSQKLTPSLTKSAWSPGEPEVKKHSRDVVKQRLMFDSLAHPDKSMSSRPPVPRGHHSSSYS